jgi:S1-C subfamily serine protease
MSNKKTFFAVSLVIVSVLSIFLAVDSGQFLSFKDLPESNFFNVSISQSLVNKCTDTSDQCNEEEILMMEGTASGVAISEKSGTTYILTADHFCHPGGFSTSIYVSPGSPTLESDIWVTNDMGIAYSAEVVHSDSESDLCLLATTAKIKSDMRIATFMPEPGETIYAISAPYGIREKGVSLHFDGIFSGCDPSDMCYYTIPAAGGSSGSLVFDDKGRIVGMIQMATVGFNSVSLGVGVNTIKRFLSESGIF